MLDVELLKSIIKVNVGLLPKDLYAIYNEEADIRIRSYSSFINCIADSKEVHKLLVQSKENRARKIEIALQDAEDSLYENASQGDIRSIEFLLKTQKEEYREKRQVNVSISHTYQEQLKQLSASIEDGSLQNGTSTIDVEIVE